MLVSDLVSTQTPSCCRRSDTTRPERGGQNRTEQSRTEQSRTDDVRSRTMPEDGKGRCRCSYKNHRKKRPGLGSQSSCLCHSALADKCLSAWARGPGGRNPWESVGVLAGAEEVWAGVIRMPAGCRQVP